MTELEKEMQAALTAQESAVEAVAQFREKFPELGCSQTAQIYRKVQGHLDR